MRLVGSFILSTLAAAALLPLGAAQVAGVPGQGTWETTLLPRDINDDGTVDASYDTVLDVSWLANANAAVGSAYVAPWAVGTEFDGVMNWANAKAWAASLDVYGKTGWRLPTMIDTGAPGCDWTYAGGTDCGYNVQTISQDGQTVFSEMAHLYCVSLGNLSFCTPGDTQCHSAQPGWGLSNTGGFRNLHSLYWSSVAYAPDPAYYAWVFDTADGPQAIGAQSGDFYAVAVRPGDVAAAVPEPQSYALLLLGISGVLEAVRRRSI